jgi:tetratricopeptide (TPR) repeat protein
MAEQCVHISAEAGQADYLIESYALLNFALAFLGELVESQEVAEKCIALYEERGSEKFEGVTAQDPGISVRSQASIVLWQLGYPDRSLECLNVGIALAEELEHPINLAQIYTFATALYQLRGEQTKAVEMAQLCIQIASEHGYDYWQLLGTMHLGIAMGALGDSHEGLAFATEALNLVRSAGADLNVTYFLGGVAQIHRVAGDADKGLLVLNQAIDQARRMGEIFYLDWLHILRGECFLGLDEPDYEAADADFVCAIESASDQKASMLQLRATICLYRLRESQGNASSVRDMLGAAVEAIVGGSDTVDVIEARALLAASG